MVNSNLIIDKDLKHIWHPCAQMKDFQTCPPLIVNSAKGSYLYTDKGPLIDALSSWWCKALGHGHPAVISAIQKQLEMFEHVIGANTTHPLLAEFGEKMASLSGNQHVFFASDGSSAVEIAMKLALHASQLKGLSHKTNFVALENSYHGETLGTLSVSDLGLYKKPYEDYGVTCEFLPTIPYLTGQSDSLWLNADEHWQQTLPQLEKVKNNTCAVIVEPILQGAGGMLCYSADFLRKLAEWAKQNGIYFIADEIMTGLGRTGKWFASEHAGIKPDLICLSKGLTSGALPLSCVLIEHSIYELFYDDYESGKSFLHSHTYSCNALAVSAALATLNAMEEENTNQQAMDLEFTMRTLLAEIASITGRLTNVRSMGAMVAADLMEIKGKRIGYELYKEAIHRGALLRPIGNTLYWLPPLNTDTKTIESLAEITLNSIKAIYS
ncbi:adenosylmethionine--8-amino-7-oxononanoate transaminase [Legionella hackeliae]|uniref:Adenosylmethionine-8-amino-7-oxononanoate aminotransferase n=1 Tax=Legionella hackeliae TaxID=449 RepID=A0A0A8UPC8_LEGHA|nr:adenosylmethionine--8-amino-7-oxononanoate transaminase [Legionella hackeliae]KTD11452.1 adenosylmethionine-8-amino-7-oxononanoate aminotransferase [Legionella hackeliae]CEK10715.1 Adenosylmethionine-8-amino-7-oxononanoate aminotransferase [Legionella hackeliae]STX47464.1 adenosylmethionine-8-amino-7-oxononanoate aminotransferase [Legionella hackeliae]